MLKMEACTPSDKEVLLKAERLLLEKENLKSCNSTPASNLLREALSESGKEAFQGIIKESWKTRGAWDRSNFSYLKPNEESIRKAKIKMYIEGGSNLYEEERKYDDDSLPIGPVLPNHKTVMDESGLAEIVNNFDIVSLKLVGDMKKSIPENMKGASYDAPKQDKDIAKH